MLDLEHVIPADRLLPKLRPEDVQAFGQTTRGLKDVLRTSNCEVWMKTLRAAHPDTEQLSVFMADASAQKAVTQLAELHQALRSGRHIVRKVAWPVPLLAFQFAPDCKTLSIIKYSADHTLEIKLLDVKSGSVTADAALGPVYPPESSSDLPMLQWTADSQHCLAAVRGRDPQGLSSDYVFCLGPKTKSCFTDPWPAVWSFCPSSQLIVAWPVCQPNMIPVIQIYNLQLQTIAQVRGAIDIDGHLTQQSICSALCLDLLDAQAQIAVQAINPLIRSMSGLLVETGLDSPTTPMLTWSRQGGVLLVTGFAIAYRAGPYVADLSYLVPRQSCRLVKGETCPLACSWLPDGNLICRHQDRIDFFDTTRHEISCSVRLEELACIGPSAICVMAVNPTGHFAAFLTQDVLAMVHIKSRAAVKVIGLPGGQPWSAVWNTAGDKLLARHGQTFYIFKFGKLPGLKAAHLARRLSKAS